MKNEYQSPELDVEIFESNDVVAASGSDIVDDHKSPFDQNSLPANQDIFSI